MGRHSLNVCLENKTKMKLIILACLLSCLLDSTFGEIATFECDGVIGTRTALGGRCSIAIGGNSASGCHVCDRLQEIDDICDYFKPRKPSIISGGSFGSSFGSSGILTGAAIATGRCEYNCKSNCKSDGG